MNTVFVLVVNNGRPYEDYNAWNRGVYSTNEGALVAARDDDMLCNGVVIEEWVLDKKQVLHSNEYTPDQVKRLAPKPEVNSVGFTDRYIRSRFSDSQYEKFVRWMRGQTTALVDGEKTYYPKDVVDFMLNNPVTD